MGFLRSPVPRVAAALALGCALSGGGLTASAAVPGTSCPVFPANNVWNTDISTLPVHPSSAAWLGSTGGAGRMLHPDFGSSGDPSAPYGIPYTVVDGSHPKVSVSFQYADESDPGPYPFGADTPIEGGASSTGDRHALMVDRSTCTFYELYDAHYSASGSTAGSGAVFSLLGNALRPAGWTSADAAGLPIFPGLLRPDEVNAGVVNHAIRFTVQQTAASYLWPARHQAGSGPATTYPPMGARFRMKAGVDISRYSHATQVVLTAFKHYGLIVADNGSNWYFQGAADNGWSDQLISELKSIPAGDFEAVDESSLMLDPNSAQARQPGPAAPPPPPRPGPQPRNAPPAPAAAAPATASEATDEPSAAPTSLDSRAERELAMAGDSVPSQGSDDGIPAAGPGARDVPTVAGSLAGARGSPVAVPWPLLLSLLTLVADAGLLALLARRRSA